MDVKDHHETKSHFFKFREGAEYRKQQAALIAEGRFLAAVEMDVADIRAKHQAGLIKNDYEEAIGQMRAYALKLESQLRFRSLTKEQERQREADRCQFAEVTAREAEERHALKNRAREGRLQVARDRAALEWEAELD